MAEYSREQRNKLSRAVANHGFGNLQCKLNNNSARFIDYRSNFTHESNLIQLMKHDDSSLRVSNAHICNVAQLAGGKCIERARHLISAMFGFAVWAALANIAESYFSKIMPDDYWRAAIVNEIGGVSGTFSAFVVNKILQCLKCCRRNDPEYTDVGVDTSLVNIGVDARNEDDESVYAQV